VVEFFRLILATTLVQSGVVVSHVCQLSTISEGDIAHCVSASEEAYRESGGAASAGRACGGFGTAVQAQTSPAAIYVTDTQNHRIVWLDDMAEWTALGRRGT
jgi:hypothetical protein